MPEQAQRYPPSRLVGIALPKRIQGTVCHFLVLFRSDSSTSRPDAERYSSPCQICRLVPDKTHIGLTKNGRCRSCARCGAADHRRSIPYFMDSVAKAKARKLMQELARSTYLRGLAVVYSRQNRQRLRRKWMAFDLQVAAP